MLIAMLKWLVTTGRPDLSHTLTIINRFESFPHEKHLDLVVLSLET